MRDVIGSWSFLMITALALVVLTALAIRSDHRAGPVAVLGLLLAALCTLGLVVVLMAAGRAAAKGDRRAAHDLESARRLSAALADLRDDVDGMRDDLARTAARALRERPADRS